MNKLKNANLLIFSFKHEKAEPNLHTNSKEGSVRTEFAYPENFKDENYTCVSQTSDFSTFPSRYESRALLWGRGKCGTKWKNDKLTNYPGWKLTNLKYASPEVNVQNFRSTRAKPAEFSMKVENFQIEKKNCWLHKSWLCFGKTTPATFGSGQSKSPNRDFILRKQKGCFKYQPNLLRNNFQL